MAAARARSRAHKATWCRSESAIASALPQAPAPRMAIFIPARPPRPGSETPDLRDLEEADLPVGVADLHPAAGLGLHDVQRHALLRLEHQRGLVAGRLPHVRVRDRDQHGALVRERLLLDPGQVAGWIANLSPDVDVDDDLHRIVAASDKQL